jgi:hypothetical protein
VAQVPVNRVREALRYLTRSRGWLVFLLVGFAAAASLVVYGTLAVSDGLANTALSLGTNALGALVTVAIIAPILRYLQEGSVREHRRMDYEWFMRQAAAANRSVQILTTFSSGLNPPLTDRFLKALAAALTRDTTIEILLVNPNSLAAKQRQQELSGASNVQRDIMNNVRSLGTFIAGLSDAQRERVGVRLYDASASITLYRWDDRALVSFLPIGRFSEHGTQLEVSMRSPLGEFVEQRFEELWHHSTTTAMEQFVQLHVTLVEDDQTLRHFHARYVTDDDRHYVVQTELLAVMARRPDTLLVYCDGDRTQLYDLTIVDARDPALHERLNSAYQVKYDARAYAFVGLLPVES